MPRKKLYEMRLEVLLPKELSEFLDNMVLAGNAENISQAGRKCIALARQYAPELATKVERSKDVPESPKLQP